MSRMSRKRKLILYLNEEIKSNVSELVNFLGSVGCSNLDLQNDLGIAEECLSSILVKNITVTILKKLISIVKNEEEFVSCIAESLRYLSSLRNHYESAGTQNSDIISFVCQDIQDGLVDILDPVDEEESA